MLALSITSLRSIRAITVESTIIVRTKSPTSAVSPPVEWMFIPKVFNSAISSSVPLIMAEITSCGMRFLLRPMVEESIMWPTAPTHIRSSIFIISASWAIPFHTLRSPVAFQYIYAKADLVPAPSACITKQ